MSNGRVSDINLDNCNDISQLYDEICDDLTKYKSESINHLLESNETNQCFFSKHNIDLIQDNIRYEVYNQSNHIIDRQSDRELSIIMRSFYLQYGHNNPDNLLEEIKYLNKSVVEYCVPKIISNLTQYLGYKKDLSTLYTPMDNPIVDNVVGQNSLEMNDPF